jgi:SAM-dependent methyltransferase
MNTTDNIKAMVKEKYTAIAMQSQQENATSCCGATACCEPSGTYTIMADDYSTLEGYTPDADLGLGCGLPTQYAKIKAGDTVIDLGSGAGNDAFVARQQTGTTGRVIGIDFTDAMIAKARENAEKLGFNNVEFRLGDIEQLPLTSNLAHVVVSNCVLNLVPNKAQVFSEIFRVLKPGGHFSISDVVLEGILPARWGAIAELYAGCVSGAVQKTVYLELIEQQGFINIQIQKDKTILIPDEILLTYLSQEELTAYKESDAKISSITVFAQKPLANEAACCIPGGGCC